MDHATGTRIDQDPESVRLSSSHAGGLFLRLADAVLTVTLAPCCAACRRPLDSPTRGCVCDRCWSAIGLTPSPLWSTDAIAAARAGGPFDGPLRDVIHAFKYEGRRSLAAPLGRVMREAGIDLLDGADCVVPVPLHPWRQVRRGFNQAADLAGQLERPVVHALWRLRTTPTQSGLTAAGRRRNVRDAFAISPLFRYRGGTIADRVVILVDDVRTTGATLNACAEQLRLAGAREVRALTAAARDLHA
jgi:ComF family protein